MSTFSVTVGDITQERVSAIVNAANSSLMGGGGVDGAIHRAGGPAILAECRKLRETTLPGGLPPGEAVVTTGGDLPAHYVIHTVGPIWHGGNGGEEETLVAAVANSLTLAAAWADADPPISSVAFPAISTGVYGYPKEAAYRAIYRTIRAWCDQRTDPAEIRLVLFSDSDLALFTRVTGVSA